MFLSATYFTVVGKAARSSRRGAEVSLLTTSDPSPQTSLMIVLCLESSPSQLRLIKARILVQSQIQSLIIRACELARGLRFR